MVVTFVVWFISLLIWKFIFFSMKMEYFFIYRINNAANLISIWFLTMPIAKQRDLSITNKVVILSELIGSAAAKQ